MEDGKELEQGARAVRIRETWIIRVLSALLRPQVSATRMAGVMTPTTAATTCWSPNGRSCPGCGMPRHWKTASLLVVSG